MSESRSKAYGGTPDGNTMLHIAVAPHNSCYPRRYEVARALIALQVDVALRNADDKPARDLNMELVDAVYPISMWRVSDVSGWLRSKGQEQKVRHLDKWIKVFEKYRVSGQALEEMFDPETFVAWVTKKMPDLTRLGFASSDLEFDRSRWLYVLERLRREMNKGYKHRMRQEAILAEERQALIMAQADRT